MRKAAFTLVELLIVVAIIALLLGLLVPTLGRARAQSRACVCGSNIRQLAAANAQYAGENGGRYCPGAPAIWAENLRRWHGTRVSTGVPFDPTRGPLAFYLGGDGRVRACPSFQEYIASGASAFEKGNGGYGYNQAYLGRILRRVAGASAVFVTDLYGLQCERVHRPAETLMFADAAFAATAGGVIEYSFAEPRYQPEYVELRYRADPSIHFRHSGGANVAWCDGHVDRRKLTFTWASGLYTGDPGREGIGWFGRDDDNRYFDVE